jgi:hypothetical protein
MRTSSRVRWWEIAGAAALYAVVTVVLTWPLFRHPATQVLDSPSLYGDASVLVQRDIYLTLWILSWDTHALVTDPLHLFHANAFYPAKWSLALSEHMLGNVPFFAPVYLATGNPVLAHQLTLLASFVVAGLAMAAYVHYWTRDRIAALAAGCLFAFAPYRAWQIGNLHVIAIQWMPLALLGADLALDGRRLRGAALCATALVLSTLCSYYVGYAAFALAGAYAFVGLCARGRAALRRVPAVAGAFGVAGAVVAVLTIPYLILQRSGVIPDRATPDDFTSLAFLSAAFLGPRGFASYFLWPRHDGIPQFLGFVVMAAAVTSLVVRPRAPRAALGAVAVTGFVLALGPTLTLPTGRVVPLPYRLLMEVVPGFSAMRVPHRFGALVTVAATALAGLVLATIRNPLLARGRTRLAALVPALVVVAALVEVYRPGTRTVRIPVGSTMPLGHQWLAAHGEGGPMIELPTCGADLLRQSLVMYESTAHWLPIANGYTPYPPRSFIEIMDGACHVPDPLALDRMLAVAPLRWVLVRRILVQPDAWPTWQAVFANAGLRIAAEFPEATIFEVPPERRMGPPLG